MRKYTGERLGEKKKKKEVGNESLTNAGRQREQRRDTQTMRKFLRFRGSKTQPISAGKDRHLEI